MKIIQNENILYETHGSCRSFDISLSALKTAVKAIDPSILIKKSVQINDNNILTIKDVKGFCIGKMENYKIPKIIEFRDNLPRNEQGKILRNTL